MRIAILTGVVLAFLATSAMGMSCPKPPTWPEFSGRPEKDQGRVIFAARDIIGTGWQVRSNSTGEILQKGGVGEIRMADLYAVIDKNAAFTRIEFADLAEIRPFPPPDTSISSIRCHYNAINSSGQRARFALLLKAAVKTTPAAWIPTGSSKQCLLPLQLCTFEVK